MIYSKKIINTKDKLKGEKFIKNILYIKTKVVLYNGPNKNGVGEQ